MIVRKKNQLGCVVHEQRAEQFTDGFMEPVILAFSDRLTNAWISGDGALILETFEGNVIVLDRNFVFEDEDGALHSLSEESFFDTFEEVEGVHA